MCTAARPAASVRLVSEAEPIPRGAAFAALIIGARHRKGWTQARTAKESGIPHRTIARWESGSADRPESELVRKLCLALDIDPRDAAVALGFLTMAEAYGEGGLSYTPTIAEVVAMLQDETIAPEVKDEWVSYLRWRSAEQRRAQGGNSATG